MAFGAVFITAVPPDLYSISSVTGLTGTFSKVLLRDGFQFGFNKPSQLTALSVVSGESTLPFVASSICYILSSYLFLSMNMRGF